MECDRYGQSTGELSLWSFLCWSGTQNRTLRSRLWASARYFPRRNEKCVTLLDAWPGSHEQWWCPRRRETRILGESGARPILAKVTKHLFFFFFLAQIETAKIPKSSCPISLQQFSFFYILAFFPLYRLYSIPPGKMESHLGAWNPFHLSHFFRGDSKAWTDAGDRLLRFQFFLGFSSSSVKRVCI